MEWEPSLLKWLADAVMSSGDLTQAERLLEEQVLPKLVPHLDKPGKLVLSCKEDGIVQVAKPRRE
jgi:hypothetical protein